MTGQVVHKYVGEDRKGDRIGLVTGERSEWISIDGERGDRGVRGREPRMQKMYMIDDGVGRYQVTDCGGMYEMITRTYLLET